MPLQHSQRSLSSFCVYALVCVLFYLLFLALAWAGAHRTMDLHRRPLSHPLRQGHSLSGTHDLVEKSFPSRVGPP